MLDENELLYDVLYERTKDFGRTQFIKEIMRLQRENQQLKDKIKTYEDPEDMTLMFMWCEDKAKDKIKELEHNWNELKKWLVDKINIIDMVYLGIDKKNYSDGTILGVSSRKWGYKSSLNKMEELEKIRGDKDE